MVDELRDREHDVLRLMAEGLTNREIAERLYISVETVRWYAKEIYGKLNVHNRTQATTKAQALGLLDQSDAPISRPKHNLPTSITPFIGRKQELSELAPLLADPNVRLITIVAPGGMGKTRLALAAAEQSLDCFADGVLLVQLAPIAAPEQIVSTVVNTLRIQIYDDKNPKHQLTEFLRDKRLLLLFDNFEHVLEGAILLNELLAASSHLKILVTSRERLRLHGETVYVLEGLDYPVDSASDEQAPAYGAIQLFEDSAQRVRPDFVLELDDRHLTHVARICQQVGGMPLGIELAAGWVDGLTPQEIADEIAKSLDFLVTDARDLPERLRSIRTVLYATWDRLSEIERDVFMRLAIFHGGFTSDAAQNVVGTDVGTLSRFVGNALLRRDLQTGRYDLHELLRQYAGEKLEASGEGDAARAAHSQHYLQWLTEREANIKGHGQREALRAIGQDFENIRAGWLQAIDQGAFDRIRAAADSLMWFCWITSRNDEGQTLLRLALAALPDDPDTEWLWAHLLVRHEYLYRRGRLTLSDKLERGLSIAQRHNSLADQALCFDMYGRILIVSGNRHEAVDWYSKALALVEPLEDRFYIAWLLHRKAYCVDHGDRYMDIEKRSLALRREIGDERGVSGCLNNLGAVYAMDARYGEGEVLDTLGEALEIQQRLDNPWGFSYVAAGLALRYFFCADFERAHNLATESARMGHEFQVWEGEGHAKHVLGWLACVTGDYVAAERLFIDGRELSAKSNPPDLETASACPAAVLCGLDRVEEAIPYVRRILEYYHEYDAPDATGIACAVWAVYQYKHQEFQKATRLLSFALNADYKVFAWIHHWPLVQDIHQDLQAVLDEATFQAAWEQGKVLDLGTVAAEIRTGVSHQGPANNVSDSQ